MNSEPAPPLLLEQTTPPAVKHSGLGIAAFIIAILAGLMLFVSFVFAGFLHMHGQGDRKSGAVILVGLLIIGLCLLHLVGLILAIGALFQADRRKLFSVLGLVLNALALTFTIGLLILGRAMK